ncbi:MAG: DNA polymerase III subunit beta [Deltaproteobacteria bacterium]|nr:DNA polymerase III subunit beta [Deltaproteobacteria bacterium]
MEIQISREELLKSVSRVQSIIERRSNMPILSTILLTADKSGLCLSATDLELGFQEMLEGKVEAEGSIAVSGRKLFEILKESKGTHFNIKEKENNWVFMTDNVARFNLACLAADEYPAFIEPEGAVMVEVEGDVIAEMVDKTIYAVTAEEAGFKLSGVFAEKVDIEGKNLLRMVSTDGHRLAMIDKAMENLESLEMGKGVMIPKKGMNELSKFTSEGGPVQIGFKEKSCIVKKENAFLVMRLLEANFPDYHAVIPEEETFKIEINRAGFIEAMRKMLILSNERYRAVKITLDHDKIELLSTNPDIGEAQENIPVEYKGERLEAGFNPRYFIDVLNAMESEMVTLGFVDNSKPCILKGEADDGFLGLIMPMRV